MSLSNAIKKLAELSGESTSTAQILYKKYWDYVEDLIIENGEVDVDGIGRFYIDTVKEGKKENFVLKFEPSPRLSQQVIISTK